MSSKRRAAKLGRLTELGVALVGVALLAYLGVSKVQEYRKPQGAVMQYTKKAINATKQAAIVVTSEAPRSFLARFKFPKAGPSELEVLNRKIAQNPDDIESLDARFRYFCANDRTPEAQADLERLILLGDPNLPAMAYYERAAYQAEIEGDYEGALPRAEYAVLGRPKNVKFQENLAYIYIGLGRDEEAVELCDAILKVHPDSVEALYSRAVAFRRMGKLEQASADFERAAKIDIEFCLHWESEPDPGWHGEENPSSMGG